MCDDSTLLLGLFALKLMPGEFHISFRKTGATDDWISAMKKLSAKNNNHKNRINYQWNPGLLIIYEMTYYYSFIKTSIIHLSKRTLGGKQNKNTV